MDEEILKLAQTISGAAEAEQGLLVLLCSAARRRWELRLRQGTTAADCGGAFLCAAALSAAADLAASRGNGDRVESFTAGEISIKTGETGDSTTEELRKTAEQLMAPYTAPGDFCFKGVRA